MVRALASQHLIDNLISMQLRTYITASCKITSYQPLDQPLMCSRYMQYACTCQRITSHLLITAHHAAPHAVHTSYCMVGMHHCTGLHVALEHSVSMCGGTSSHAECCQLHACKVAYFHTALNLLAPTRLQPAGPLALHTWQPAPGAASAPCPCRPPTTHTSITTFHAALAPCSPSTLLLPFSPTRYALLERNSLRTLLAAWQPVRLSGPPIYCCAKTPGVMPVPGLAPPDPQSLPPESPAPSSIISLP